MPRVEVGAEGQPLQGGMIAQLHGPETALVAGAFALRVGPYALCAAEIDALGAVQIAAGKLPLEFQQDIEGPPTLCTPVRSMTPLVKPPSVPAACPMVSAQSESADRVPR